MRTTRPRLTAIAEARQFEVFPNPSRTASRAYPYVVVLQSSASEPGRTRLVAPLAPLAGLGEVPGRLAPLVTVEGRQYRIFLPWMFAIPSRDLHRRVAELAGARGEILSGVDLLFFGI